MPPTRLRIFVSSVQRELAQLRADLKLFLLGDAVLRRFIAEVFLFEELPARDQRAYEVYLEEVERADVYLGIFGYEYGSEDDEGISPTEHEFDHAGRCRKIRLVFVWGTDEAKRSPKMKRLIEKASSELVRRRVSDPAALTAEVYASVVDHLDRIGALRVPPFDTAPCEGATLRSLSRRRLDWFLATARRERSFPLPESTATKALLVHLNLLAGRAPTNAAVLLFGSEPQRFHTGAVVKCIHCHGSEYRRPVASLQVYGGDLFAQADQALDFVLAKVARAVGTRAEGITAPATYELPPDAVAEAILNALAHRDYHSNGSVEVRLFSDRLEVWNPGSLPGTLSLDDLREDHASVPNNPLIAESLYLARYIERIGSGTQAMIALCREAGLPGVTFEQRAGSFLVTLWRDWLTPEALRALDVNDRQRLALEAAKARGHLTNSLYRDATKASKPTASRDLEDLVAKGILTRIGTTGKGTRYVIRGKGLAKGSKGSGDDGSE